MPRTLRERNAEIVAAVRATLASLGVDFVEDRRVACIEDCVDNEVTLVTSKEAFEEYDEGYPERIACIVVRRLGDGNIVFRVCVNNRDVSDIKGLRAWWAQPRPAISRTGRFKCAVCRAHMRQAVICSACCSSLCRDCDADARPDETCRKCPVCGDWQLNHSYGAPFDAADASEPAPGGDAVSALCSIIQRLDGCVTVVPRANNDMHYDKAVTIHRLPGTDRYAEGSLRLKDMRVALQKTFQSFWDAGKDVMVYIVHPTWAITEEVSAFIAHREQLMQLGVNAWRDVIPIAPHLHRVQVEYSQPHRFELPPSARALLADIDALGECEKTVSISWGDVDMSYDAFESSAPTTMHVDMRDMLLATKLRDGRQAHALCILDAERRPKVAAWSLCGADQCKRLRPGECRRLVRSNVKGLVRLPPYVEFTSSPPTL